VVDLDILIWLALAALVAGWVDAVAGGGGLLQVPALLLGLPGPGVQALGTNKVASVFGTAAATGTYLRKVRPDMRAALPMTVLAFVGSLIGAATASSLPEDVFRPVIIALLVAAWIWVAVSPAMGSQDRLRFAGRRHAVIAAAAGALIGFYDGLLGPGTGSFLLIVLVGLLGYSFLSASVTAKIVNLGTNVAAIIVFGLGGYIWWQVALVMAVFNVVGAVIGARMALRRGSGFVRVVFLVIVAVLIVRLIVGW
jgi:uncharacterized membrane protein YfcA